MFDVAHTAGVAVITLKHGKANTLDIDFCNALTAKFLELEAAPDTRAIVMTAEGKIFSGGVDLVRLLKGGADYVKVFLPAIDRLHETVFRLDKPVVSAINGHAIAGGCMLACAADYRVMAKGPGRMGMTEMLVGVPVPSLVMEMVRFIVAPQYFEDIIFNGATFPVEESLRRGFINEVVEPDAVLKRAMEIATRLGALPGDVYALTKKQNRMFALQCAEKNRAEFDAEIMRIWTEPETFARIQGYMDSVKKG